MQENFRTGVKWFLLIWMALRWNPRLKEFVGKSWESLAHLRAQQSDCNAVFMTFQNTKLERGFCFSDLIVFQAVVKSLQQVFFAAGPRPRGLPRSEDRELSPPGLPLPSAPEEPALARVRWHLCGDWGGGEAGRSPQTNDTALPYREPHQVQGCGAGVLITRPLWHRAAAEGGARGPIADWGVSVAPCPHPPASARLWPGRPSLARLLAGDRGCQRGRGRSLGTKTACHLASPGASTLHRGGGTWGPASPSSPPLAAPPQVLGTAPGSPLLPSSQHLPLGVGGPGRLGRGYLGDQGRGAYRGDLCQKAEGSKEQAAIASSRPWRSEVVSSPGERGTPRERGDAETATAGRAGRGHAYSLRLRLPRPLGLRLELGLRRPCAPGPPVVCLQALPRFPLPALRGPRPGVVQPRLYWCALWSPRLHRGSALEASTLLPGGGEDWREGAKTSASQKVISAPSELALWLWLRVI